MEGLVVNASDQSRSGSGAEIGYCDDSGSFSISGTWDGPPEPGSPCLDGWVTSATLTPVNYYDFNDCPHAGVVEVSGADDESYLVRFNSDGSMEIGDEEYASCDEITLPEECGD